MIFGVHSPNSALALPAASFFFFPPRCCSIHGTVLGRERAKLESAALLFVGLEERRQDFGVSTPWAMPVPAPLPAHSSSAPAALPPCLGEAFGAGEPPGSLPGLPWPPGMIQP